MKYSLPSLFIATAIAAMGAPSAPVQESPAIIPAPLKKQVEENKPGFSLSRGLPVFTASRDAGTVRQAAGTLIAALKNAGISVSRADSGEDALTLSIDAASGMGPEGYAIDVTPEGIRIVAGGNSGAFYAAQTLIQSIVKDAKGEKAIPSMKVEDSPRFKWRGLMVDSGRNPRTVDEIKKIIDLMSMYKMNTLHWHLTDDQGWRIEIKKYPRLTTIGATRASTPVLGNRSQGDGKPFSFHYTQSEIRDVVKYANERAITVVPEIEVPGHATAAITAYPELGNKDIPNYNPQVVTRWGVFPDIFSPSEETFTFLDNVMAEVVLLFPKSPYIHIGGDEAPKDQWNQSAFAKSVMEKNGLKNAHELQSYFIRRTEDIVNKKGKKIIGWDEIQEGGLSKTAVMMVWRDWKWARHALDNGNEIIMTPTSHCYLDYGQIPNPGGPGFDVIGGHVPIEKVYSLDPMPEGLTEEQQKRVLGVQGNCWSEYLHTMPKWEYMIYPRAIAMAEVAWSIPENKKFDDFMARWDKHKPVLKKKKVNFRQDDGSPAFPEAKLIRE